MIPTAEQQLHFLHKVQLLLDECSTNTTYKFALLLALADYSVEQGDNIGAPLTLPIEELAKKFIRYYWRQTLPYPSYLGEKDILKQHHGSQAAIISKIINVRNNHGRISQVMNNHKLIKQVASIINDMPLWRLQNLANKTVDDFLYEQRNEGTIVSEVTLRAGVAYCFRVFHSQIVNMVQGAWVRWIRNEKRNHPILGQHVELNDFLFGSERQSLTQYLPLLKELQSGTCFYCGKGLGKATPAVDHFIPWSRYPVDFGHNFVLAHHICNNNKSDLLAGIEHLTHWIERNDREADKMIAYFDEYQISHDLPTSLSIALWAYDKVESMGGDVWLEKGQIKRLSSEWRSLL